jgi:hypothetical protein
VVAPNGDTTHWATNGLCLDESTRLVFAELAWPIEEYHRGLKQFTGVNTSQQAGYFADPIQYSASRVRRYNLPAATAGVANETSPNTFLPSNSNSLPAFTT